MLLIDIDEKFVYIINYLKEHGYKTFASCDGTLESHKDEKNKPINAYIAFIKSPLILDLFSAFMKDKDTFSISITNSYMDEREYLGNILSGNEYSVYFENFHNEKTDHFVKIIEGITKGEIKPPQEERNILQRLDDKLASLDDSELEFLVIFNTNHQSISNRKDKTNRLTIYNKESPVNLRDLEKLAQMLSKRFGMEIKDVSKIRK